MATMAVTSSPLKGGTMANNTDKRQGWHGDPQGHADAGQKGGLARKRQIRQGKGMSYEEMGEKGGEAAQKSGRAHRLTREERSRGGRNSRKNQST